MSTATTSKEQIHELVEETANNDIKPVEDISILATVQNIKAKSKLRSLAGEANAEPNNIRTLYQAQIWIPIILIVTLFVSVMSVVYMDLNKENDTLIYAKFITSSRN